MEQKLVTRTLKQKKTKPFESFIAGSTAGVTELLIMYPTELVKTQMQLFPTKYKGPFHCASVIVKESGWTSLYKGGLKPLFAGTLIKTGLRFTTFDMLNKYMKSNLTFLPPLLQKMLCGGAAGVVEALVAVIPMETIKTKFIHDMNSPNPKYNKGMIHGVSTIIRTEGFRGIYKGVSATVAKQGGNQMSRFAIQGVVNDFWVERVKRKLYLKETFVTGGIAGFFSSYMTQPFDTAKTKMQGLDASKYKSLMDCMRQIVKENGPLGLWKGITPRAVRVSCSTAIIFTVKDAVIQLFHLFSNE